MNTKLEMRFERRPSTLAFMTRAILPSPGLRKTGGFPPIHVSWARHRIDPQHLAAFVQLTGLRAEQNLPLLYPHVFSFPLQMVILTHPAHPIPIWNSLQIRNHLLQHRPIPVDAVLDLETRVTGQRILEKGAEVDLHTALRIRDELVWESLNTFYYRGRFGEARAASPLVRPPGRKRWEVGLWSRDLKSLATIARPPGEDQRRSPLQPLRPTSRKTETGIGINPSVRCSNPCATCARLIAAVVCRRVPLSPPQ